MLNVLLTGFEDYKDIENPTKIIINEYRDRNLDGIEIIPEILPVSFRRMPKRFFELVDYYNPDLILGLGFGKYAQKLRKLRIERYGANRASGIDEDGRKPQSYLIEPEGSKLLEVNLPVDKVYGLIVNEGIPAFISKSAGYFLCNHLIYIAMRKLSCDKKFGFFHIPIPGEETLGLELIVRGVDITLESS